MADKYINSWGFNGSGRLGNNGTTNQSSPVSIARAVSYSSISAGDLHCLAIDAATGAVWSWGANTYGQLGTNNTVSQSSPVSISRAGSYKTVAAGKYQHSMAIDAATGMVWTWGINYYGSLGDNSLSNKSSPVSIARNGSYSAISAGKEYSLAIDVATGMIWVWGDGDSGRLGTNNTSITSSPVSIARIGSYNVISAGNLHGLAIDAATGMIWSWGHNGFGQLGTGDTNYKSSPVSIARAGSYIAISAGEYYSLAIDSTGAVWAWGLNNNGQLGINNKTHQSSPVSIARAGSYIAIAAAATSGLNGHSLTIDSAGTIWAWGYNNYGELGTNNTTSQSSPVSIASTNVFSAISAGDGFSLGLEGSTEVPPVADFVGNPTSISSGAPVSFTDLSIGPPTTWAWTFGDGGTSTAQNPTHAYLNSGYYTVTLTVTNDSGSDTKTSSNYISVHPARRHGSGSQIIVKGPGSMALGCDIVCEGNIDISGTLLSIPSDILNTYFTYQTGTYTIGNGKSPSLTSVNGDINITGTVTGTGFPAMSGPGCNAIQLNNLGFMSPAYGANHAGLGTISDISGVNKYMYETIILTEKQYQERSLLLSAMPSDATDIALNIIHGTSQIIGTDFLVNKNQVTWAGLLETNLLPGDELRFIYYGNTTETYPGPKRTYGSYEAPTSLGSGSGTTDGGGGIHFLAPTGTVFLNGTVNMDGGSNFDTAQETGGGSGGSIWVESWNIDGTGALSANGGTSDYTTAGMATSGSGSGGYISLWHGSSNSFSGPMSVSGPDCGGDGVVFSKKISPFLEERFTGYILNSKWWEVIASPVDQTNAIIMDTTTGDVRNPSMQSKFSISGNDIHVELDYAPSGYEPNDYNSYFLLYADSLNWVGMAKKYSNVFGVYCINGIQSQTGIPYDYSPLTFWVQKQDTTFSFLFYDATSSPQLVMSDTIPALANRSFNVRFGTAKPPTTGIYTAVEYLALTGADITNKYMTFSNPTTDASNVAVNVINGPSLSGDGTDFILQGMRVIWDSSVTSVIPPLEDVLLKGDIFRLIYESDASNNTLNTTFDNFRVFDGIIDGAETTEPVLYVDPVLGNDTNSGRQLDPLKNLFVATAWAKNNSIVVLYDGTYTPTRIVDKSLTILNAYGAQAVITSINSQDTTGSNWENSPITLESCQASINGVTLVDSTYGIYAQNTHNVEVRDCTVVDSTGLMFVQYTADPVVARNTIQAGMGVRFDRQVYHPYVYGNVIYDSSVAVYASDTSAMLVSSNTLDDNDIGIIYDTNSCGVVASNNITNSTIGVKIQDATAASYNNNFYNTSTQYDGVPSVDSSNISSDPLYVNAAGQDYMLNSGSPDRSSGIDTYDTLFIDRRGMGRTKYPGYDIGAYEYSDSTTISSPFVRGSGDDYRVYGSFSSPFRTPDRAMILSDATIHVVSEYDFTSVDSSIRVNAFGGQFDSYYFLLRDRTVQLDSTVGADASAIATIHSHYSNVNISREIYVSSSGSDSTVVTGDGTYGWGNGTVSNPYRTIQKALQDSSVGDNLIVSAGTYPILSGRDGRIIVPYADRTGLGTGLQIVQDMFPTWDLYNHNIHNFNWNFTYDGDSTVMQGDGYLSFISDCENPVRADSIFRFGADFEASVELRASVEPLYFSVSDTTNYVTLSYYDGSYIATVYTNGLASSCWGCLSTPVDNLFIVNYLPITAVHVANKFVPLNYIPNNEYPEVVVGIVGGTQVGSDTDYYIEDSKIKWDGMDLDGIISAGDVLRVVYIGDGLATPITAKLSVTGGIAAVDIYDHASRTWTLAKKKRLSSVGSTWTASLFMDPTAIDLDFHIQKTFLITSDPWRDSYDDEGYGNRIQNTYL